MSKLNIDLKGIVKTSLDKSGLTKLSNSLTENDKKMSVASGDQTVVKEAYSAQPKKYGMPTEFMTQKTKEAHLSLYQSHIEALNKVSAELDTANSSNIESLKIEETSNLNSVWLHELFFAADFDPHSEIYMDSISYLRLERDFGSFDNWQKSFILCGLVKSSGWIVTGYNMFLKRYMTTFISGDELYVPIGFYPLIVLDMHEHAYFKDYMDDKKSYIVSRMREFNWNIIEERFTKAEKIHEALK